MFNEVPEDLGTRPQLHESRRSQSPPTLWNVTGSTPRVNRQPTPETTRDNNAQLAALPFVTGFDLTQFLPSCFAMYSALSAAGKSWSRTFTVSGYVATPNDDVT